MSNNFFKLPDKIFGLEKSLLTLFLTPVILLIFFLISLNLVLIPKANEIGTVNQKIDTVKTNTDKVNEKVKYLASVDSEELQRNAEYLDNAVLRNKKSYLLVEIIRQVANKFDYQIESFSLTPGEIKAEETKKTSIENMKKLPVALMLHGPKDKSLDLVLALEKTLPILFIDKYDINSSGSYSELEMVVSSYYLGDEINVDTTNIALNDLILSSDEAALVEKISSFTKIEENTDTETSEFQQYQRENPFSL